jgi:tetratricopeptide (TPR) repeat protein
VLAQAAKLAGQQDYPSERARALYKDGLVWERQGETEKAVEQYRRSLDIAVAADDLELANRVRGTAAAAYESLGSTSGAIAMLDNIDSELAERPADDEARERAASLFEKGRLLLANFRFAEAKGAFEEAMAIQAPETTPWGETVVALAQAHYAMGEMEQAIGSYRAAIPHLSTSSAADSLLTAYGDLAAIYRHQGRFESMSEYRALQAELVAGPEDRAAHLLETALDAWREQGLESAAMGRLLLQSRETARQAGDPVAAARAGLLRCLNRQARGDACGSRDVAGAHRILRESGIPDHQLEADYIASRIARTGGDWVAAADFQDRLLEEMAFYRQALPGVLAPWYWQFREDVFQESLLQSLSRPGPGSDGRSAVLALERIRRIGAAGRQGEHPLAGESEETLRVQLARLLAAVPSERPGLASELREDISRALRAAPGENLPGLSTLDGLLARL